MCINQHMKREAVAGKKKTSISGLSSAMEASFAAWFKAPLMLRRGVVPVGGLLQLSPCESKRGTPPVPGIWTRPLHNHLPSFFMQHMQVACRLT
jgi:hypothetical protein